MNPIPEFLQLIELNKMRNQFLSKQDVLTLLKAIKRISSDTHFIDSLIFFDKQISAEHLNKAMLLTPREKQILHLIGLGSLNQEIATKLQLRVSTVETHRKNIRKKLNLPRHRKLLEFAIINNLKNGTMPEDHEGIKY